MAAHDPLIVHANGQHGRLLRAFGAPSAVPRDVWRPSEAQLRALREFCEASGMDKLVIVLNARLDAAGGAEGDAKTAEMVGFFEDGGEGGFETSFAFLTQPLGVNSASEGAASDGDPLVLYRKFPQAWVLARKPAIGPPRTLLERDASEGRPSADDMRAACEQEKGAGLLGGLLG